MHIINQNGKTVMVNGGTMTITNGKILIDGKPLSELEVVDVNEKVINITIQGNVERLEVDYCKQITINGDCKRVKTQNGNIDISGDVDGDVHTSMGSITCGNVNGDVHTSMGNINRR